MNLIKKTYFYEDYTIERLNNYYIINGVGRVSYKEVSYVLEEVFKDYCLLGKNLFLCIEKIDFFSRIFIKNPKKYNIVLLPFLFESKKSNNDFLATPLKAINFGDEPSPNNNGIIEIKNYDELIHNSKVINLLLDFCRKYGMPYYENVEENIILEGLTTNIPLTIHIKDFLLTAITIYLLTELNSLINAKKDYSKNLIKIMSLPSSTNRNDIVCRFNSYIKNLKELYTQEISSYKSYTTSITTNGKDKGTIKTINLVQALIYYYLNIIELRGSFGVCCKCGIPTANLLQHLCCKCYDGDYNYYNNTRKKELNAIHRDLKDKLISLNNNAINELLKKDPYNIHNPNYDDLKYLEDLCKYYDLI